MAEPPTIGEALNDAIQRVVQEHEDGFTLKWVALLETAGPDGTRGVWVLASPDIRPWDALGLIEYARLRQADQILSGEA